jgi:hypothetical protein
MLKTAKEVEAKIREGAPGRWAVGEGAYLQVAKVGKRVTASWLLRYQRDGRGRHMGLGPVGLLSLSEARDRARDARRLLLDGIDPLGGQGGETPPGEPRSGPWRHVRALHWALHQEPCRWLAQSQAQGAVGRHIGDLCLSSVLDAESFAEASAKPDFMDHASRTIAGDRVSLSPYAVVRVVHEQA